MYHQHLRFGYHPALLTLVLLAGAAGACVPIPHTERVSPELTGVLRSADGTGISGVVLATSCAAPNNRTTTDSLGRFALPGVTQHYSWLLILGDKVSSYSVCALDGRAGTVIYRWVSMAEPPARQALECIETLLPVPMTTCRERS